MPKSQEELKVLCKDARRKIIKMLELATSGHPGGSLSLVEIVETLFHNWIKRTPANVNDPNRDRFVLSKGHGVPVLYAVLSQIGIVKEEELWTLRRYGSRLQGHPDCVRLPAVECSTGSLGQGLSTAQGIAMAGKIDKANYRVYCVVGDGETQEGQIWEAIMSAPKYKLDNLCVILDYNKAQIDGYVKDVLDIEPIKDKLTAFNWHVIEIDGNDLDQIEKALQEAKNTKDKPTYIIAHTVKGKGVSFMENKVEWHGSAPNAKQAEEALQELK